jgi:predicted RNA-binding Zn-ribbon protein involved in translation (DUF1610 family)
MKCKSCKEEVDIMHMCGVEFTEGEECDYCGQVIVGADHEYAKDKGNTTYVCNTCGRTAVKPEYLCNPNELG